MACAPSATPKKPAENGESTKFEALLNRARVAGSLDDLSSSRKDGVKGVKAAEFGGTGDLQDHSYTITTNAFAGMAWDDWLSPNAQYSLMPFVSYRHVRTQDNSAKEHVFGAGANGQLAVSLGWGGADVFNLASYYTTDSAQGQKIWTGTLDWEPGFFQQEGWPFGRFAPVVPDLVLMRVSPKAIFTGGNVFDNGGNADLADTKTFARVGGYIGLSFRGFPDTLLDRFEWTSTYKYLYGISGAVTNYHLFSSRISYVFPNRENYTFSAGYQVGRLEDTLQQVEKWDFAFGIRF
jgi:hypothetical protein